MDENQRALQSLQRLSLALADLDDKHSALKLSHWRELPEDVSMAYQMMTEGSELVKATSTKYTLVGKIDAVEGSKIAKDLLKGCELVGTGALVLCNDDMGCSRSVRQYAKQAARAVVATSVALIQAFVDETAWVKNTGAQKTGAVWSTCDAMLKIPKGNRNSMRRDLLVWTAECNETMEEFSQMIQLGPSLAEEGDNGSTWDDFCGGDVEQYSALDLPIAQAGVALIKCSRGSMNVAIKACECAGEAVTQSDDAFSKDAFLEWISTLHSLARRVGEGMTDLGTLLYPPLELKDFNDEGEHLAKQLKQQTGAIVALHQFVLDASPNGIEAFHLTNEVTDLATKLQTAAQTRYEEAQFAIDNARDDR